MKSIDTRKDRPNPRNCDHFKSYLFSGYVSENETMDRFRCRRCCSEWENRWEKDQHGIWTLTKVVDIDKPVENNIQ
jgi:hypothetical protein